MLRRTSVFLPVGHPRPRPYHHTLRDHPLNHPSSYRTRQVNRWPHRGGLGPLCGRRAIRVGESRGSTISGFPRALWFINTSSYGIPLTSPWVYTEFHSDPQGLDRDTEFHFDPAWVDGRAWPDEYTHQRQPNRTGRLPTPIAP